MSFDIQTNKRPPLYVPEGRPLIRTKFPNFRPAWLDAIKRPLLIHARNHAQFSLFIDLWRLSENECVEIATVDDLRKRPPLPAPLLVLPRTHEERFQGVFSSMDVQRFWESRGGMIINLPWAALVGTSNMSRELPIEVNMAADTICHIAKQRYLDSLKRK